jgi:hypothetical protein
MGWIKGDAAERHEGCSQWMKPKKDKVDERN